MGGGGRVVVVVVVPVGLLGHALFVSLLVRHDVLELVELVQQQVLDPLGPLRLERLGPQVAREVGELLGEREDHELEHELEREEGIVLADADELQQRARLVEHQRHLRLLDLWLVGVELGEGELLEAVGALRREELARGEVGVAHEAASDDRPLCPRRAREGGGGRRELGHVAHAHAPHLGPVLDLARGEALQQHGHVVAGDVMAHEHVRID
mmetsp:Transcript_53698/g.159013  ORF Transcript_53698/g.159013 Transcript_53698/m.159013 type:complete len:212 (+) Transcript_53698:1467-2102(+)